MLFLSNGALSVDLPMANACPAHSLTSAPEVSAQDIERARSFYNASSAFGALPTREQEIILFLDTICPLQDGPEQTIDVCLGFCPQCWAAGQEKLEWAISSISVALIPHHDFQSSSKACQPSTETLRWYEPVQ